MGSSQSSTGTNSPAATVIAAGFCPVTGTGQNPAAMYRTPPETPPAQFIYPPNFAMPPVMFKQVNTRHSVLDDLFNVLCCRFRLVTWELRLRWRREVVDRRHLLGICRTSTSRGCRCPRICIKECLTSFPVSLFCISSGSVNNFTFVYCSNTTGHSTGRFMLVSISKSYVSVMIRGLRSLDHFWSVNTQKCPIAVIVLPQKQFGMRKSLPQRAFQVHKSYFSPSTFCPFSTWKLLTTWSSANLWLTINIPKNLVNPSSRFLQHNWNILQISTV